MNIVELIDHLKSRKLAEELISRLLPEVEFGMIEIFMKENVSLESEINLFDAENIPTTIVIEVNGIKYENFFPLSEAQEMVEDYVRDYNNRLSSLDIAKRMFDYRLNDA
ncbi:hypothetical protein ACTJJ0_12490 [Chitinophaga sp. 22321]|uniref:Uncharacterized protein n=1 Tax=Chitinophaga hostae TaxID=2831022 RepID=A0ABS5IWD9_9BACT|nr:hypothetical protein [Chitinophaga hostae]MBS0027277.1 hypothetical protein [Chitinophaga hostae]